MWSPKCHIRALLSAALLCFTVHLVETIPDVEIPPNVPPVAPQPASLASEPPALRRALLQDRSKEKLKGEPNKPARGRAGRESKGAPSKRTKEPRKDLKPLGANRQQTAVGEEEPLFTPTGPARPATPAIDHLMQSVHANPRYAITFEHKQYSTLTFPPPPAAPLSEHEAALQRWQAQWGSFAHPVSDPGTAPPPRVLPGHTGEAAGKPRDAGQTPPQSRAEAYPPKEQEGEAAGGEEPPLDDIPRCHCPYSLDIPYNLKRHEEGPTWRQARAEVGPRASLAEALERFSSNRTALVMMTNYAEVDLVENYLCSLFMLGVNKYVIVATDEEAHRELLARGHVAVWDPAVTGDLPLRDDNFNSGAWKQLVQTKLRVAQAVLKLGYHLFFTDVDVVWRTNVFADVTAGPDGRWLHEFDPEKPRRVNEANTGFYFLRATTLNLNLIQKAMSLLVSKPEWDDQKLVNFAFRQRKYQHLRNYLPKDEYKNGCGMKEVDTDEKLERVKALHANCAVNKKAKYVMLCRYGLWHCGVSTNNNRTTVQGYVGGQIRPVNCQKNFKETNAKPQSENGRDAMGKNKEVSNTSPNAASSKSGQVVPLDNSVGGKVSKATNEHSRLLSIFDT